MKLAFVLFHYFPYGGLERDMLAIATACHTRGYQVTIYTQEWVGDRPIGIEIKEIDAKGYTNHGRAMSFSKLWQQSLLDNPVDLVVGFNKMPGLDIYFAADVCFAQKAFEERSWLYRHTSRCRDFLRMEDAVFGKNSKTQILMIAPAQITSFKRYYQTPDDRLHLLPPGINRHRIMPENYLGLRKELRTQYGLSDTDYLLLMVGSDFRRKGVELAIRALNDLPIEMRQRTKLWVAGKGNPQRYIKLAQKLGVRECLSMLGARDDVSQLMWAADIFLHPAHSEAAGAVLLEAAVAGLPVIATDVCGYATYVAQMNMGRIIGPNDVGNCLGDTIAQLATIDSRQWYENARKAIENFDIFSMHERAVQFIEAMGRESGKLVSSSVISPVLQGLS